MRLSKHQNIIDDLHARLTKALIDGAEVRGVYQLHNPDMKFLADVIIDELGLKREDDKTMRLVYPYVGDVRRHRYVSEWTVDE